MPRPMTIYRPVKVKHPEHSFIQNRHGVMIYAKYGNAYVVPNKTLAENKVAQLRELGYNVERSGDFPYTILLIN